MRDVVTRVAESLKQSQHTAALILGRGATISKAVTVCEIVKRAVASDSGSADEKLIQETRIYKKMFGGGRTESCIEIKLSLTSLPDEEVVLRLEKLA